MSSVRLLVSIGIFFLVLQVSAQDKVDKKLQSKIQDVLTGFHGKVGVFVKDLSNGRIVAINADSIFPTASMIKVPILIGVMDKIRKGELVYHQDLQYKDSLLYAGVDILGSFRQDEKITLSKVIMLMLTTSDNTASLWLQSLAGTGSRINEILDSIGFVHTRVNSRTPGRESNRSAYGWGQTTPREMCMIFEKLYRRQLFSKEVSDKMLRLLGRNYWDEVAISQIPPTVFIASKNGAVDASRSEALLVVGPNRPYVFCISTNNNSDQSWDSSNEAWQVTRKLSALLWNYFEPRSNWNPGN